MEGDVSAPATQAVDKVTTLPVTKARRMTSARSALRSGAIVDSTASCEPIEPGLAKPHSANVAIVSDRLCAASAVVCCVCWFRVVQDYSSWQKG